MTKSGQEVLDYIHLPNAADAAGAALQVLTLTETAALLRVSPRTIRRLCDRGILHPLGLGGRILRFRASEINSLIGGTVKVTQRSHLAAWHAGARATQ